MNVWNRKSHQVLCLVSLLALGAASHAQGTPPTKACFIYLGPVGDSGWTYQHDLGRAEMEKTLGSKVSVKTVANTNEGPDSGRVARELSADGCNVIFGASFGYMKPLMAVATEFPKTSYLVASGYLTDKNFGGYNAKWHEGGYLAGIVAGKTTKGNVIGFVGPHPVPDVMWYLNAFALGARSVNPKVVIRNVFINSWYDPTRETEAANALMNQGVDVLAHFTDTPAVAIAAESRGVGVISFHSDMRRFAPKNYLTGLTHQWGAFYARVVREVAAGTWKPELYMGGLADGVVKMAPMGPRVTKETADLVEAKQRDIASGKFKVFTGPIRDQKGTIRVAAGSAYADADLGKMNWFAEGILGGPATK
ncbi:MAG: BMP family ABC transporter substrate-binding protein [Burkholderiaceae bacterium]